ncbi:NADH-quinone oxidoreductase subunit C [Isosphaeraceae bacterium EP7]
MATAQATRLAHNEPIPLADVPHLAFGGFRDEVVESVRSGGRLVALFGRPVDGRIRLYAVLALDDEGELAVLSADVPDRYPSLTPDCPSAHMFEREIAEQWGVVPEGHPWLKPVRFHASYRPGHDAWGRSSDTPILPGVQPAGTEFYRVEGQEVHEVAVGPVHAGVIEPGAFRFQCHGERVFHLEIALGFQHRGIEKALWEGPNRKSLRLVEQIAGDTSVGHATAYCQAVEALAGARPSLRAQAIRGIALELERMANHTGDLGALANDVGYLPTASYCGRIRGDFLNSTAMICGNRFGRGLVRPGGVGYDLDGELLDRMRKRVEPALVDVNGAAGLLWDSLSVQARFEGTGTVSRDDALALGLVGPAGRSSGLDRDVRLDYPSGIYRFHYIPISVQATGDVFARAYVRYLEVRRSGQFVLEQASQLPEGPTNVEVGPLTPSSLVVSLVEGWRGEICHVAITDDAGAFAHYKVIDPSFHNWIGLSLSLRDQGISDFPLCNKSFNLSYCGHDL